MADQYVETTSQSWFSRLGGSIKGIFVGLIMVAVGAGLLFWGEGRAVKRAKTLKEGAGDVVAVSATQVDTAREGSLIHVSGRAETSETLVDGRFGVQEVGALALHRDVEMYQWIEESRSEEKKKLGGGTETVTTYTYRQDWSSSRQDSSRFKEPGGHENPQLPFSNERWEVQTVQLGSWTLAPSLAGQIGRTEERPVDAEDLTRVPEQLRAELRAVNGAFYWGRDPSSPEIGDTRVRFKRVPAAEVSVVGQQRGSVIDSYKTKVGGTIALLAYGAKSADEMFEAAKAANTTLTWILRFVGFIVILFGFLSIFKPLSVILDVVPFLGNLMEKGVFLVSLVAASIVALIAIALGWIFFRPLLGIALLVAAGGLVFWILKASRRGAAQPAPAPSFTPPPPPPPPPAG